MEFRKLYISILCVSLFGNIVLGVMYFKNSDLEKSEEDVIHTIKEEKPQEVPNNDQNQNIENKDFKQYIDTAVEYLNAVKNGKSNELYTDRISKVKKIISDSLYQKLVPELSEEELEGERKNAANTDPSIIVTNKVTSINAFYIEKQNDTYEIVVIYTINMNQGKVNETQRYLTRMDVQLKDGLYKIINIYEDSMLLDGVYGK